MTCAKTATTTQIEGFREDFEQMSKLIDQYSQFLKAASKTYQQAQDDTVATDPHLYEQPLPVLAVGRGIHHP